MKPVMQDIFNDEQHRGNCFTACLASILEVDLHSVPNFYDIYRESWREHCEQWLAEQHHIALISICEDDLVTLRCPYHDPFVILTGRSPRVNWKHAVVGQLVAAGTDITMIHDPHYENNMLAEGTRTVYLLVRA